MYNDKMRCNMENNYILNRALIFIALSFLLVACSTDANIQPTVAEVEEAIEDKEIEHNTIETDIHIVKTIDDQIIFFEKEFANRIPSLWGENINGVITKVNTRDKVVALTFDACGSNSDGY